jgi:hypothetical protein
MTEWQRLGDYPKIVAGYYVGKRVCVGSGPWSKCTGTVEAQAECFGDYFPSVWVRLDKHTCAVTGPWSARFLTLLERVDEPGGSVAEDG